MAGDADLDQLLAAPIVAMNDAQADAAATFFELLDRFAFEPAAPDADPSAPRRLRTISFVAERATSAGVERREISLPLLQMIPLGGVTIDSANIRFSLALTADPPTPEPPPPPPGGPVPPSPPSGGVRPKVAEIVPRRAVQLKARIAPASGPAGTEFAGAGGMSVGGGNLEVEMVLRQIDLPAGFLDMIAETQGGMSRRIDAAAGGPAPLFAATISSELPARLAQGQSIAVEIEIAPDPAQVGAEGLALAYAAEPAGAFEAKPSDPIRRIGRERVGGRVKLAIADVREGTALALVVHGTAPAAEGAPRRHSVRLALPPAGPAA